MEIIGGAGVLEVMDEGGQEGSEYFEIGHPVHKSNLAEDVVNGLGDISSVQIVVIGILEFAVAFFDFVEEDFKCGWGHLELVYNSVSIEQVVAKVFDWLSIGSIRESEHVERPVIEGLWTRILISVDIYFSVSLPLKRVQLPEEIALAQCSKLVGISDRQRCPLEWHVPPIEISAFHRISCGWWPIGG